MVRAMSGSAKYILLSQGCRKRGGWGWGVQAPQWIFRPCDGPVSSPVKQTEIEKFDID